MECYFGSYEMPEDNPSQKTAVVTFHIPELGIRFKAPFAAENKNHSGFASLLALLEFIEGNQKYFANHTFEIFGDNRKVIEQVNLKSSVPNGFDHLLLKALKYRDKLRFSLSWIPLEENSALEAADD
jgi:hypothetical protein